MRGPGTQVRLIESRAMRGDESIDFRVQIAPYRG
jgi:hypothetical protein